jgi:hypothetical protein
MDNDVVMLSAVFQARSISEPAIETLRSRPGLSDIQDRLKSAPSLPTGGLWLYLRYWRRQGDKIEIFLTPLFTLHRIAYRKDGFLFAGFGHDQPKQQVQTDAGHAARDGRDQKGQPEPESADAEEFGQTAADTGQNTVMARAAQRIVSYCSHGNLHRKLYGGIRGNSG